MAKRIPPFDDSLRKDRRRNTSNNSTDTTPFDAYRQGVELSKPSDFTHGIAKIHDGYNDQSGQHGVPDLVLGQSRPILRDDVSYLEMAKFDPVARFYDPPESTAAIEDVVTTAVLSSLNYTVGDIAGGGASIVLTGTGFTDATDVKFGTTSATFVVDNSTQITATLPAHAAGSVSVTVVNAAGASNGISFEYWTPTQLSPKLWARGPNYTSTGGTAGNFTDSGSLADNLVQASATSVPAEGNITLRQPVPDFDGTNDFLSNATAWNTAIGTSFFVWVLFYANSASSDPATYRGNLIGDAGNAEIGLDIGTSGLSATLLEGGGIYRNSSFVACSTGAWHLGLLQSDSTVVGAEGMIAVDNGSWSTFSVLGGYGFAGPSNMTIGKSFESRYFDGYQAEVGVVDGTVSAANITRLRQYCNQRYGVSV